MAASLLTDGGGATSVSALLIICLSLTASFVLLQVIRITRSQAPPGSYRRAACWRPWTVQKHVHALIFVSTVARAAFFVLANFLWDPTTGEMTTSSSKWARTLFYLTDELPLLLSFSVGLTLALFWAEVHYNGEDEIDIFRAFVQPAVAKAHIVAYVGLMLILVGYSTMWRDSGYYIVRTAAYYVSGLYLLTSVMLIGYARLTAGGIMQVPLEIQVRRRKQREIWTTTLTVAACYAVRVAALIALAGRDVVVDTSWGWVIVFLYFWLIETAPYMVLLYYFHRLPVQSRELLPYEDRMMLAGLLGGSKRAGQVSTELIENTIKRLSLIAQE